MEKLSDLKDMFSSRTRRLNYIEYKCLPVFLLKITCFMNLLTLSVNKCYFHLTKWFETRLFVSVFSQMRTPSLLSRLKPVFHCTTFKVVIIQHGWKYWQNFHNFECTEMYIGLQLSILQRKRYVTFKLICVVGLRVLEVNQDGTSIWF